jgi:DNA primase
MSRLSLVEVAQGYGLELRRSGRTWVGRCPFHPDTRPSFHIYPDNHYHCFGCRAHGSVIDFVAWAEGMEWKDALLMLAQGGVAAATAPRKLSTPFPEERQPTAEELAAVHAAWEACLRHVGHHRAEAYLRRRGISPEAARALGMGYWAPGVAARLEALGLVEAALAVGLLRRRRPREEGKEQPGPGYYEPFRGRIIIADISREGKATWLTGRAADDTTEPKYLNVSLPKPILGLEQLEGDRVVLVEGPLDWAAARIMGLPAAATLGVGVSKLRLLPLARFRRVVILFDSDEAGKTAARELAAALGTRAVIVSLPGGIKDVAEALLHPDLQERVRAAVQRALEQP